jgi:hypothetical protein
MDIELQTKLLKLKGYLNEVNHISYTYAQLGRSFPMNTLSESQAKQLVKAYIDLLDQVKNLIMNYENPNNTN